MDTSQADLNEKLSLLMRAGVIMLENGAATYRVDETLSRLGRSLNLARVEVFATPTGLIVEADSPSGESASRVARVSTLGVNMNRLALLSDLSRGAAAEALTAKQIADRLSEIESQGSLYSSWAVVASVSIACAAFALLFGGGWREVLSTFFAAALAMLIRLGLHRVQLVPLMVTAVAAFGATAASSLGCRLLTCAQPDIVPIAAVLQLVPGVPLVTSVIDLATGDIISGIARGTYAILIAFGVALGMLLYLAWGL